MPQFDFAYAVLCKGAINEVSSKHSRNHIFKEALETFGGNPVKIFQVGAIESFDSRYRVGSGWSDLVWGEYIKKHGGKLDVVDIDLDHLANSAFASMTLDYTTQFYYGNAGQYIKEGYDIYYLDGGNDPKETLNQFSKIEHTDSIVIIDDYKIKGVHVDHIVKTKQYDLQVHEVAHWVGVINLKKGKK